MAEKRTTLKKLDWLIAAAAAALAALLYFPSMAKFAYPGESAHLQVLWRGLDSSLEVPYPLMDGIAKLFGAGNLIAPVCGTLSTAALFLLVVFFVRKRLNGEYMQSYAVSASRLAGIVAAAVFALTPAVHSAATHLEPRLFAVAWALLSLLLLIPLSQMRGVFATLLVLAFGGMWGAGAADSMMFILMAPFVLWALVAGAPSTGRKAYMLCVLFLAAFSAAFFSVAAAGEAEMVETWRALWTQFKGYTASEGWMMVLFFSTIPFVVSLFSSNKAYNEESGWVQWLFHLSMGVCSILAIATPLSPSSLMAPSGILPVATSTFVAFVAGYLAAYWWLVAFSGVRRNESADATPVAAKGYIFGYVAGGVLAVVYLFTILFGLFTFDDRKGEFADRIAARTLDDLGERTWFVSDGTLDDHLRLLAAERGRELNLVSLNRDLDKDYLATLTRTIREKGIGGSRNADLALSLSLGVLPFVQDWFVSDPATAKQVAIYGAPDLWYSSGMTPVPELLFYGADGARAVDAQAWKAFDGILAAAKGWGSYQMRKIKDPMERKRLEFRRHLGFVANNRGVWLQDQGKDDEAYDMYAQVLDEIDSDNICALFNLFEMATSKHPKAAARKNEFEQRLKAVIDDPSRRYRLWQLSTYYGYIRKPEMLIRLGFTWARSGRPGEALSHISRAIDFVPTDRRTSLMNMMAALYASDDNREKSREFYEKILAENAKNRDALLGMMRLSLMEGANDRAADYLARAVEVGGDDPRVRVEKAMLALMKQDLASAKDILKQATDADPKDLRAWSLLATVTMQQVDAAKDVAEKKRLEKELEVNILPAMEKQAREPNDYYVQTTRAFLLMRKGRDEESRRAARDAFEVAAKVRPDITATQDLVMGLDISLDDTAAAERHAREALRRNRNSPLANYVMGSLALRRNDYDTAERYLRKAADAKRPVVLAMNDLAEVYRRMKRFPEAERYARNAVKNEPNLYVAWETIGSVIMDANGDLDEAQRCVEKACELSKVNGRNEDIRMLVSLARVQVKKGDKKLARVTLRKVQSRISELSEFEKGEYDRLMLDVR